MNLKKAINGIYDEYLCGVGAREMGRLADFGRRMRVRNLLDDIDFDKRVWLRKVGLQPYAPRRASLGTGMLFMAGAVIGVIAGRLLAPTMRGEHSRKDLRQRWNSSILGAPDYGETRHPARA
jgi:hypothetical protein